MTATIRIQETYDLSTAVNKMGLLGIHTPGYGLIKRLYPGFLMNYKYMRAVRCDLAIACASVQPADPLQIGTEAGSIAPQDLFNPILYRAVSTDSFNTILNRMYGLGDNLIGSGSVADSGSAGSDPWNGINSTDIYYALLSESGWAKAMPQAGFAMSNLVPLVYEVLNTFGNTLIPASSSSMNTIPFVQPGGGMSNGTTIATTFRGSPRPMPRIPTTAGTNTVDVSGEVFDLPASEQVGIPKTFVACIVMPPAKQHILYFRLKVVWTLEFTDTMSMNERATIGSLQANGAQTYASNIIASKTATPDMQVKESMLDADGVSAEMIMQS